MSEKAQNRDFPTFEELALFSLVSFLTREVSPLRGNTHTLPDSLSCPILSKFHLHNFEQISPPQFARNSSSKRAHRWSEDKGEQRGGTLDATRQILPLPLLLLLLQGQGEYVLQQIDPLYQARPSS